MADASDIGPEFRTTGEGYSPDKFYVTSVDAEGGRSFVGTRQVTGAKEIAVPPWVTVQAGQLVTSPAWPAYRSLADVVRDGFVHIVHRRLEETADESYAIVADEWGRWFEQERLWIVGLLNPATCERWEAMFRAERDPERRAFLMMVAREQAENMPAFWREQLLAVCNHAG